MDCIDCHNAAAHRIAPTAEQAVDRAIAGGQLNRQLPFVRREAIRLVKSSYGDQDAALQVHRAGTAAVLRRHKARKPIRASSPSTIDGVKAVYARNVFPDMKVTFGVYADNIGHITSNGCFRCHDDTHTAKDGSKISADCEYCHTQVEIPRINARESGHDANRRPRVVCSLAGVPVDTRRRGTKARAGIHADHPHGNHRGHRQGGPHGHVEGLHRQARGGEGARADGGVQQPESRRSGHRHLLRRHRGERPHARRRTAAQRTDDGDTAERPYSRDPRPGGSRRSRQPSKPSTRRHPLSP